MVEWYRAEAVDRLAFLRRTDPGFTRFGSAAHRYSPDQPLTEADFATWYLRWLGNPEPR
jgi:hypothetical protein